MNIIFADSNRYELDKIIDNGYSLRIELITTSLNSSTQAISIQTQGNYQYAVLDDFMCSHLDFPIPPLGGLLTQFAATEFDFFQIQPIAEHYQWSYFCVNTEHQIIMIVSDKEPIVG